MSKTKSKTTTPPPARKRAKRIPAPLQTDLVLMRSINTGKFEMGVMVNGQTIWIRSMTTGEGAEIPLTTFNTALEKFWKDEF